MDARKTRRRNSKANIQPLLPPKNKKKNKNKMDIENRVKGNVSKIHQKIHESDAMSNLHDYISELLQEKNINAKFTVTVDIKKTDDDVVDVDVNDDQYDDFDEE